VTIRARLLLGFLLAVLVPTVIAAWLLTRFEDELYQSVGSAEQSHARGLIDRIDRALQHRIETLDDMLHSVPQVSEALRRSNSSFDELGSAATIGAWIEARDQEWIGDPDPARPFVAALLEHPLSELLRGKQRYYRSAYQDPVFAEIFLTNRYGANVAQTALTTDYRQDDESWWQQARRAGLSVGEPEFDLSAGVYAIDLALRLDDDRGKLRGILKAVLHVAEIEILLSEFRDLDSERRLRVVLVDRRGQQIFSTAEQAIAEAAGSGPDGSFVPPSVEGFRLARTSAGDRVLQAWVRSEGYSNYPGLGWTLMLELDADQVLQPVARLRRRLLIAGFLGAALVLLVATFLSMTLGRPLREATASADRLRNGELGFTLGTSKVTEVAHLLDAMGTMLGRLRQVVRGILGVTGATSLSAGQLAEVSQQISTGAQDQAMASEQTSASAEAMVASNRRVASHTRRVADTVVESSAAVAELAVSVQSVSETASQLASAVQQTFLTMDEMSTSIHAVAESAQQARRVAAGAVDEAAVGEAAVDATLDGMGRISTAMAKIESTTGRLKTGSQQISGITAAMDTLAKQTHLLAINASIQATHAGRHGEGFAVVAEEISALAKRSAESSQQIGQIISGLKQEVNNAVNAIQVGTRTVDSGQELAQRAGVALRRLGEATRDFSTMIGQVSRAMQQQADFSARMLSTFERMRDLTQQVDQATREQADGSRNIAASVEQIRSMTQQVSMAMGEQSRSGEQIAAAMHRFAQISANNSDTAAQIVAVSEELLRQSRALEEISAFFDLSDDSR